VRVRVRFVGTIGTPVGLAADPYGLSYVTDAYLVGAGGAIVHAPDWSIVSIRSFTLENAGSAYTCPR
jgi:hypothetical protein